MKHELQVEILKELMQQLDQGRNVDAGAQYRVPTCRTLTDDALLTTPFANLALVPEAASSQLLPSRIGHVRAFAMFAVGEPVNATDAVAWGLANKVVLGTELRATAHQFAVRLTKQPLGSLVATKKLMRAVDQIHDRMDVEGKQFGERLISAEAQEAFTAFAQRRTPDFSKF